MPNVDWTRVLIVQLSILASIVLLVIAWHVLAAVSHTLIILGLAAVLAFVLAPLANHVADQGIPRGVAVGVVYVTLAVVLVLVGLLVSRPFLVQAALLVDNWPTYVANLQARLAAVDLWLERFGLGGVMATVQAETSRFVGAGGTLLLGDSLRILQQFAGSAVDTVIVVVTSFYVLTVGPRVRTAVVNLTPAAHRSKAVFVEESLVRMLGGYLRGQLLLAASLAVVVTIGLSILGMPYAIVLGVLAGLFELVPMFGPILGALPALGVALFQPFPMPLWVLLFFIAVQQLENHVLVPRISGHAVGLHPLGAILALLAGLELGGLLGAIFAVPIAGFLWVIAVEIYRHTIGAPPPDRPAAWRLRRPAWRLGRPERAAHPAHAGPRVATPAGARPEEPSPRPVPAADAAAPPAEHP